MNKIIGLDTLKSPLQGTVLTMGSYDGLHLGHRALLGEVLAERQRGGGESIVLTFDPHPIQVLQPDRQLRRLFPLSDLETQLELLGIDRLVIEPFTLVLAALSPEEFWTRMIFPCLAPRAVIVGHDFSFGSGKSGNISFLQIMAKKYGFDLKVIAAIKESDQIVSSTRLRNLISGGKVDKARQLLTRPFSICGSVSKGLQKGRQLGFPTANIENVSTLIPLYGVYCTLIHLEDGQVLPSITNVGTAPTVRGQETRPRIETHILANLPEEIYNQRVVVSFFQFIRNELKFSSVDELKKQIHKDVREARVFWQNQGSNFGPKFP